MLLIWPKFLIQWMGIYLLKKLKYIRESREKTLNWFFDYFKERYQVLSILNETGITRKIDYGMNLGSKLGPLLFVIYMNNLSS